MNDKLYSALRRLGIYPGPARDIARRFPDEEDTDQVLIALRAHVHETDSIPIAVWRLKNGILLTGGGAIDNLVLSRAEGFIREPPPNYPSIQHAEGASSIVHRTFDIPLSTRRRRIVHRTFYIRHSTFDTPKAHRPSYIRHSTFHIPHSKQELPMKWSDFDPYLTAKHFAGKTQVTLTIDQVVIEEVYRQQKKATVRTPVIYFRETKKGLVLSPTNQDKLEALFGDDIAACFGQRITLEVTPMRVAGRDLQVIRLAAKATKPEAQPPAPEPHAA